jgi:hypothetical protein
MKNLIVLAAIVLFTTIPLFAQKDYDFRVESAKQSKDIYIVEPDSINYQEFECTAVYDEIFKSTLTNRFKLFDYWEKKNYKIYEIGKQVIEANTSCMLYQGSKENKLLFQLCKKATVSSFNFTKNQKVKCKLLILTLYEGKNQEIIRLITSMKQID